MAKHFTIPTFVVMKEMNRIVLEEIHVSVVKLNVNEFLRLTKAHIKQMQNTVVLNTKHLPPSVVIAVLVIWMQ